MNEFVVFIGQKDIGLFGKVSTGWGISKLHQYRQGETCVQNSLEGDTENVGSECCGRIKDMNDF